MTQLDRDKKIERIENSLKLALTELLQLKERRVKNPSPRPGALIVAKMNAKIRKVN